MINLNDKHLILASQSPRRRALLSELNIPFTTKVADIDESFPAHLKREEIPLYLAEQKALAMKKDLSENDILITADTIVWQGEKAVNKPLDREDAFRMIENLSGKMHEVFTGVQILSLQKQVQFSSATKVYFSELSPEEIDFYIDTYQPFDKAGAYGIQEWIGYIGVEKIEGSFFNVMGLPVHQLYQHLKAFV